jgi:hypothetical protein
MMHRPKALLAQFDNLQVSGLTTANQLQGGVLARGLVLQRDATQIALATGNNDDVVLPQLGFQGVMLFALTNLGDAVLRSIAPKTGEICSVTCPTGMLLALLNQGSNKITTTVDTGGTAGNRFTAVVEIDPGFAGLFVYDGHAWNPFNAFIPAA